MVKDKAYVCNFCRKVITYAPEQGGSTFPCPFCKSQVRLPLYAGAAPAAAPARTSFLLWFFIPLAVAAAAGGTALFVLQRGTEKDKGAALTQALPALMRPRVIVAPSSAAARGAHAEIAVTEVRYGCPEIYNDALKRSATTDTPVLAVKIAVTNTGKTANAFRSWRIFDALGDQKKAVLTDPERGVRYSLVSFGVDSYPVGTHLGAQTEPGATVTDTVLFMCAKKPESDLLLTLSCENVGGRSELSFTIPRAMIQ